MFTEISNEQRADWAEQTIETFDRVVDPKPTGEPMSNDAFTVAGDLLANMMHWADREGLDWDTLLERAAMHHEAEVEEEVGL